MEPQAAAAGVPENLKERLKASYDAIAPKYNEWTIPHSAHRMEYLDRALGYLDLPDKDKDNIAFLELGCGCGLPVTKKLLSYPRARVVANDLSATQIALARDNLLEGKWEGPDDGNGEDEGKVKPRLELIQGDMTGLSFPSGSFDLVVGFYSLIHLPRSEQVRLLERIAQWLKPGGYFVANFSKAEMESSVVDRWLDDKGWMFWSGWGEEKTLGKIREVGFDVVVADVVDDAVDASFLWVIAKR
ncbi:methyltransferase domain-containing protein [Xylariaceae sp. AK1471]|nr:methyltransferase domain-containing protein [Xylariaceae sp. AK1471]